MARKRGAEYQLRYGGGVEEDTLTQRPNDGHYQVQMYPQKRNRREDRIFDFITGSKRNDEQSESLNGAAARGKPPETHIPLKSAEAGVC